MDVAAKIANSSSLLFLLCNSLFFGLTLYYFISIYSSFILFICIYNIILIKLVNSINSMTYNTNAIFI
jgi:hypothetical protein